MKNIFLFYSRYVLFGLALSAIYFGWDDYVNPGEKKFSYALTLLISMVFIILPAVFISIFLPNKKVARWANISHECYISLTKKEQLTLKWGKECEKKGSDNKFQQVPKLVKNDIDKVLYGIKNISEN